MPYGWGFMDLLVSHVSTRMRAAGGCGSGGQYGWGRVIGEALRDYGK